MSELYEGQVIGTRAGKKKRKAKKTWIFIIPLLIILFLTISLHIYWSLQYKPEKVVQQFEQAVDSKDEKLLAKMINEGQTEITVTEKEMNGYINYLTKINDFPALIKKLEQQSSQIQNKQIVQPIKDVYGNDLFLLKKQSEKKWGLYDPYVVEVIPFTIMASANFPNTEIMLNEKKVKTVKENDEYVNIGKLIPGDYRLQAENQGEYSHLKLEKKIDFTTAKENIIYQELQLAGTYVDIESNYEDALLFVNDKDTNMKIADAKKFGPLATDGSVSLYAERAFPTGKRKSEEVTVARSTSIYLPFEETQTEAVKNPKKELETFLNTYVSSGIYAINYGDFSYVSNYLDPSGPIYKESRDYAAYLYERGIKEEVLKVDVTDYEIVDAYTFKVSTYEEYYIYNPVDLAPSFKAFRSQYSVKVDEYGDMKVYELLETKEI